MDAASPLAIFMLGPFTGTIGTLTDIDTMSSLRRPADAAVVGLAAARGGASGRLAAEWPPKREGQTTPSVIFGKSTIGRILAAVVLRTGKFRCFCRKVKSRETIFYFLKISCYGAVGGKSRCVLYL